VSLVAMGVGIFGVYAGWHWKLLHRSVHDVARYRKAVRAAKKAQWEHLQRSMLFGVAALFIVIIVANMH
jgi:hypothetical protein